MGLIMFFFFHICLNSIQLRVECLASSEVFCCSNCQLPCNCSSPKRQCAISWCQHKERYAWLDSSTSQIRQVNSTRYKIGRVMVGHMRICMYKDHINTLLYSLATMIVFQSCCDTEGTNKCDTLIHLVGVARHCHMNRTCWRNYAILNVLNEFNECRSMPVIQPHPPRKMKTMANRTYLHAS